MTAVPTREANTPSRARGWAADTRIVLRGAVASARKNRITTTAQALAYSLFLAIPATLLVVLGVFSLVASAGDVDRLLQRAHSVMPAEATTLLEDSLRRSTESPRTGLAMTVIGAVLALWTTSSAATTLMQGITAAFEHEDERGFFHKRALALVIVVCLVGSAALVGGLLVFGPYLERWVGNASEQPSLVAWAWWTAQWPILVLGLLLAFGLLLYLGPDADQPSWRLVTPGAVAALVVWLAASGGFAFYSAHFGSYNKTWGTLSAVVVMLVWLWLTSAALLFGAEINAGAQRLASERSASVDPALERTKPV
jgi:membrane protein